MSDPGSTDRTDDAESHVVTAFLRNRGEVLLARRSEAVGTYTGRWGAVSGYAEGEPDRQVRVEIAEETGLEEGAISLVRSGRSLRIDDETEGREWVVHPYLFDVESRSIERSEEHDEFAWVPPTSIPEYETVPKLRETYERVAPTVRSITADDDHGAAYLSVRALEVLRDRAGLLVEERDDSSATEPDEEWDELAELARRLLEARPAMAVLRNRVNRAMATALENENDGADAVLEAALEEIDRTLEADRSAAEAAQNRLEGNEAVATLSRSGTILDALEGTAPRRLYVAESRPAREGIEVAESRPAREGIEVAESLADKCPVTVHTDAAIGTVLASEPIDRVLVGADTIRPDGAVVNKTGTRLLALAAHADGVPVSVVAATDKISTRETTNLESGSKAAVYDGDDAIDVLNPTFDVTPADWVDEYVTERGVLEADDVEAVAAERRELERWRSES